MPAVAVAALISEGGAIDSLSGRLTIFNALDTISAPLFPATAGKLWFITVYEVGPNPDSFVERVVVTGPGGEEFGSSLTDIKADGPAIQSTHTSIHNFAGVRFPAPGSYSFVVFRAPTRAGEWVRVAERRLNVVVQPEARAQATESAPRAPEPEPIQH